MLSSIIAVMILAAIISGVTILAVQRKKHGSKDYMKFFQENEKKG